ncbi:MAG: hypothetical protein ABJB12_09390 [Pseudomonadota bacterium]
MSHARLNAGSPLALLALSLAVTGCDAGHASSRAGGAAGAAGQSSSNGGGGSGAAGSAGQAAAGMGQAAGGTTGATETVVVSAKTRTPVTTTRSVNYWMWTPTWGDPVSGTDAQIAPLGFDLMRVGGYNNDANTPDPFNDAELDRAVAYARAIGAQPLLQVPLLADISGQPPTADTAAAMVTYANLTKKYGIKYFSIGNEPDMYARMGSPSDASAPAIVGYTPEAYCTSARAYAAAMKKVDPTIQIVGPDLAYQYIASADWLTPVLKSCGELFDIVAIHRYPFAAKMATLAAAEADVAAFRNTVKYVRGLMQATGQGNKPLAFTEMNIDYDELPANPPPAVAGTVPSALWAVDILGAAQELALRSTALWSIADDDTRKFGLIGVPPAHAPRPQYYAYQLFAAHSGPSLLTLTSAPKGVHAYPTRNAADNTTQLMLVNWQTSSRALEFQVTDLSPAPTSVVFTVPGLSIAAVDIPDHGTATAMSYGLAEQNAARGPVALMPGAHAPEEVDAGAPPPATADAGAECSQVKPAVPLITTQGRATADGLSFGAVDSEWASFEYAGSAQAAPMLSVSADGSGLRAQGALVTPLSKANNYVGFGIYFKSDSCIDASAHTGVQFDLSGDLGTCSLRSVLYSAQDLNAMDDPGRGQCQSNCAGPGAAVTSSSTSIRVPFTSLTGGAPLASVDAKNLVTIQWQLGASDLNAGCTADITIANVTFY